MTGTPPVALAIAGSDSGGGAGIQADCRTFSDHGVFGATVLTAVTAQNGRGVHAIEPVRRQLVLAQLDAVVGDLPLAAVKTGMLASEDIVDLVAERVPSLPNLVVDPVLASSAGQSLCAGRAVAAYWRLLPHATVAVPNLAEAAALAGMAAPVRDLDGAATAAAVLGRAGTAWVVVTGGHLDGDPVDVLCHAGRIELLRGPRVRTTNDHGTGCVFSAAIAAGLARGNPPGAAIAGAKAYTHRALAGAAGWRLGSGRGPLSWGWNETMRSGR